MPFLVQIKALMRESWLRLMVMAERLGMARQNLGASLSGQHDARSSTLNGAADSVDAEWVLVPRENLAEIRGVPPRKGAGRFALEQAPVVIRSSRSECYGAQVALDLQCPVTPLAPTPDPIASKTAEHNELA